jgi:hypothetical protein
MQYAPKRFGFFSFLGGSIVCWIFLAFSVLNVFPTSSQRIPNIPNVFIKMFIAASQFYLNALLQEEALCISISNISIVRVKKIILGRLQSFMGAF